jgi:pyruvate ferredoxin oxidoreductase gamma subunit
VKEGTLLVNTPMSPAEVRDAVDFHTGQAYTVNATHIAIEEIGREITNTPMLGALARATGMFELDQMAEELRAWFGTKLSQKAIEANVRAMRRAAGDLQGGEG